MNNHLQEKIDNYHSGRMTPEERVSFENEMVKDPSLASESNFQKDIIDGLKDYRKTQLKARLNAIEITPTWIEFAQQSTLLKSFGGVAIATVIGVGVYFYTEPDAKPNEEEGEIRIESPIAESFPFDWNIKPAKIPETKEVQPIVLNSAKVKISNKVVEADTEVIKEFKPTFDAPNASKIEDEEAFETVLLDELPDGKSSNFNGDAISVDTEITESLDVKYKYYDGKLFLSGDFNLAPYEILEINSARGRRIYVKYLNKYYKVEITDKLSMLPEVKNQSVIKELKLLRQNK